MIPILKKILPSGVRSSIRRWESEIRDRVFLIRHGLQGHPALPPRELMILVAAHDNPEWFCRGSASAAEAIRETMKRNGAEMERLTAVLDFGCGAGRIMRQWQRLPAELHGTDYNPQLINWCRRNLKFATFQTNTLNGPLSYDSDKFDLIYAFSVFTHLPERLQLHWIAELARVLRPGGHLYLTTHGQHYFTERTAEQKEALAHGDLVVIEPEQPGTNYCAVFHPEKYVREQLAERHGLAVIDFIPRGARGDSEHDVYLLRKSAKQSNEDGRP